ncbi:MAG: ribosome biogenesis GTPase Der [Rhodospirillales bacterium]|nr:ribosome biogenesis GTPase Der [Rhodospirillales bacterium]MSP79800.1 ribosome biogenesis GTPase Der [Rhodospirillales bacterium]
MLRVAIVGRPNVGKSTLFNRLVGKKLALVDDTPGVTRDWREAKARLGDLDFTIIDTAGFEDRAEGLEPRMRRQTEAALSQADAALLLIDARAGVNPLDRSFAVWLRRMGLPVIVAANKCEGRAGEPGRIEAFALGFGEAVALSAEHGEGLDGLYDALSTLGVRARDETAGTEPGDQARPLQLAILGRPNVGKSTLVNRLLGEERMLTGPEPGITRDSIAVAWSWRGREIKLVDTAGLRRKAKVVEKLERLSVGDTLRAVRFAEVVVLMVDATCPFEKQDLQLARMVEEEGRALVLAVNKWDLVESPASALRNLRAAVEKSVTQARGVALVTCSAQAGTNLDRLMEAVFAAHEAWNRKVSTSDLNRWLEVMTTAHPPPISQGRAIRIRYMTQTKTRPPTFLMFVTKPADLPATYLRYLSNGLRQAFALPGVPIRFETRKPDNPYAGKKRSKDEMRKMSRHHGKRRK